MTISSSKTQSCTSTELSKIEFPEIYLKLYFWLHFLSLKSVHYDLQFCFFDKNFLQRITLDNMKQRQTIGGNIWNACSLALPCLAKFQYFVMKIARKLFFFTLGMLVIERTAQWPLNYQI